MISVLLVDDSHRVREALVDLLSDADDITVTGQAEDGDEVVAADRRLSPDVILMDIAMRRLDGLQATERLLDQRPDARVVLLTGTVSPSLVERARDAGAVGYQLKGEDPGGLVDAVRRVAQGGTAWSPRALAQLSQDRTDHQDRSSGATAP